MDSVNSFSRPSPQRGCGLLKYCGLRGITIVFWHDMLQLTKRLWALLPVCLGFAVLLACATRQENPSDVGRTGGPVVRASSRSLASRFLSHVRQLTYAGRRSGEGYFSVGGDWMVFQSEREPGNPFFQIYLMNMETGDTRRVSPGIGKTTCGWIHPSGGKVLFASTHKDPEAEAKQKQVLEERTSGTQRRYEWDFDEHYDIFERHVESGELIHLTSARGYDAEGCYSPDGSLIVFTSNRHAFRGTLSEEDANRSALDPSYLMDIYTKRLDTEEVHRLTTSPGYDGGPFFSPDGDRICWRRFTPDGKHAEVFTMRTDGTDQRQITHLGAMSWAPFYHPSGDYLIFTTNVHGFSNFELYLVDAEGRKGPVRVTDTDGFDGLPVFTPDGEHLVWTSNRGARQQSQLFVAQWSDAAARSRLGLPDRIDDRDPIAAWLEGNHDRSVGSAAMTDEDLQMHIERLASETMEGRMTGTRGEVLATRYVAELFRRFGLEPTGDEGSFIQTFEFISGVSLGPNNRLSRSLPKGGSRRYEADREWRPLTFSKVGGIETSPVVFAGYGIHAPSGREGGRGSEYDSYAHLDVKDHWVVVFRYMPEDVSQDRRQQLARYASLRYKAMVARDKKARGLIVVSGPRAKVKHELVPMSFDASLAGTSIATISVTNRVAAGWMAESGRDLRTLQAKLDRGGSVAGFLLPGVMLSAVVDIKHEKKSGRNVLGRLSADEPRDGTAVVVGAHIDHLGRGHSAYSLDVGEEAGLIFYGADDNASGVSAMIEMAQYAAEQRRRGELMMRRDLVFAAWSGEEIGLLGSNHYVADRSGSNQDGLYPEVTAYINMDMVGRYGTGLTLNGMGSSTVWRGLIERANVPIGLNLVPIDDSFVPSDATTFYANGVPVLSAFTGVHRDYHTPRDTPDKINYAGAEQVTRFLWNIVHELLGAEKRPEYVSSPAPRSPTRSGLRAYLGTVPDYSQTGVVGVRLSGVAPEGPAARVDIKGGDIVVELAGRRIENIYDYTYAIDALKIGQQARIVVLRNGQRLERQIVPESRE